MIIAAMLEKIKSTTFEKQLKIINKYKIGKKLPSRRNINAVVPKKK